MLGAGNGEVWCHLQARYRVQLLLKILVIQPGIGGILTWQALTGLQVLMFTFLILLGSHLGSLGCFAGLQVLMFTFLILLGSHLGSLGCFACLGFLGRCRCWCGSCFCCFKKKRVYLGVRFPGFFGVYKCI